MNSYRTSTFVALLFGLIPFIAPGQSGYEFLLEPRFNLVHKPADNYSMVFAIAGRTQAYAESGFNPAQRQIQLEHFSSFRLNAKESVAAGLMFRNRDWFGNRSNEIRITQQYNRKSLLKTLRFGHRIRAEQRLFESEKIFRFRYRLALDFPLQGERLDVKETYMVIYSEALLSLAERMKGQFDNRIAVQFGWAISVDFKAQIGLEQRLEAINLRQKSLTLLLSTFTLNI